MESGETVRERDQQAVRERWLGFGGADESRIAAAEERLGCRLPPSYRTFLEVSDGWRHAGGFVWVLAGSEQLTWHQDAAGLSEYFPGELDEDSTPADVLLAGMWGRSLELSVEADAMYVLMDPGDVDDSGEWAVYVWASWHAAPPTRYGSFEEYMRAMHRQFHHLTVGRLGAAFVNDTTRALDAAVEQARLDALRGRYEQAETALAEAKEYGRPRAKGLYDQIRRLSGHSYMVDFQPLATDPVHAPELLPVLAADHARDSWKDDRVWAMKLQTADSAVRELGDAVLGQVRDRSYRYAPDGPFGQAVEEAREQARWGRTDEAWHILRAALPQWRPLGPELLAPVGLLADPFLGPVCGVRERGLELLATPRAGETGDAPVPAADIDPPGLGWLAEPGGEMAAGYRFVLVEGVRPDELPGLIGAEQGGGGAGDGRGDDGDGSGGGGRGESGRGGGLRGPESRFEARFGPRRGEGAEAADWEDRATAAVGLAAPGWSFAFEGRPQVFNPQRFVSPAVAASRGGAEAGRAVVVWSADASRPGPWGVFHLSVAQDGEERYAFTARWKSGDGAGEGGREELTIDRRGDIPGSLDPERFFGSDGTGEAGVLDAVAAEFGVGLPRFALTEGRAHTLITRSWTRPPQPGETYAVLRFVRHRDN
ncbi:SMI1/KNR4 family protein [Streptomyces sp. NPDC002588]|uniref:SMI1/KNR4 family protein n=1 Tax=Streptomyces sp. NPDC002588 TaxID=3154419 RepID=UPI00331F0E4C